MDEITYSTTTTWEGIRNFVSIGKTYRLRFPDGGMRTLYEMPAAIRAMAVARCNGRPVGMAVLTWYKDPNWGNTFNVYVAPSYRRRGIGTGLIRAMRKRMGRGFSITKWNKQAKNFYDAVGY